MKVKIQAAGFPVSLKNFLDRFLIFWIILSACLNTGARCNAGSKKEKIHISGLSKIWDNFHSVETGVLYRSGQLSSRKLKKYIKKLDIKTVVNLRGHNKLKKWWQDERQITHELGVSFYNIAMSASRMSSQKELKRLLLIYKTAPKPILIHCLSGSDRTGEAAALWVLEQQKKHIKKALKQLSTRYGHIEFHRPAKKKLIRLWKGEQWLNNDYQSCKITTSNCFFGQK